MSSPQPKSAVSPESSRSFLREWSERKIPAYIDEYGGERAGVPKGEDIPFPPHKVKAAVALLAYGAPKHETLTAIARSVRVSCPLLRVWRAEPRFLALYRRAVWECADEYVRLLGANWPNRLPAPYEEFQKFFGLALQDAILRRLCVDVLHMAPEWKSIGLTPKWLSECKLVGPPPKTVRLVPKDKRSLANSNVLMLLSIIMVQQRIQDPLMAQWASSILMDKWITRTQLDTTIRKGVKEGRNKAEVLGEIDFIIQSTPLDDVQKLYRLVNPSKKGRRRG